MKKKKVKKKSNNLVAKYAYLAGNRSIVFKDKKKTYKRIKKIVIVEE